MDSLHVADAVLVGHSMGGAIAAEAAIAWPDRVRGLVLIGSSGLGGREPLLFRGAPWPVVGRPLLAFPGPGVTQRPLRSNHPGPRKVVAAGGDPDHAPRGPPPY